MHKTFKDLFDLWYAPCSILLVQPETKKSEYIEFKFGQLASDIELKNLFSRFDDNGYVVGGANLNGHRMPKDEVYGCTVANVTERMKKKGDTDEYFPTFYVVICKDIDKDENVANIVLERLKEDYPYVYLKNLFSRFDDNGYVVGGANLNGHRMPKDEVYGCTVANVTERMKKKGDTDEYFPTFYVVICKDIDKDENVANIVLERLKEDYPYVYLKKPWKPSYPILGHIHERSIYRLEENGDEIVAVFDSGAGGVADRIVFDKDHAKSIRRIIATNKCL